MPIEPRDPRSPVTEADLEACTIGGARRHDAPIYLAEYDARWPEQFAIERGRLVDILGPLARRIEHVGSTSVPGLAAKPIIRLKVLPMIRCWWIAHDRDTLTAAAIHHFAPI